MTFKKLNCRRRCLAYLRKEVSCVSLQGEFNFHACTVMCLSNCQQENTTTYYIKCCKDTFCPVKSFNSIQQLVLTNFSPLTHFLYMKLSSWPASFYRQVFSTCHTASSPEYPHPSFISSQFSLILVLTPVSAPAPKH